MKIYFAPLEGITGYIYRNQYNMHFGQGHIDKYFIPFISPNQSSGYTGRERADIAPEHNRGMYAVPQILTNNSSYFIRAARMLSGLGYREINFNLGCPSGTVASKFRGAGFLAKPDMLDAFLDEVFSDSDMRRLDISIKTRIGMADADEFGRLLAIYNKYPLKELIIHSRLRTDFYKNKPDWKAFGQAVQESVHTLCYNGDIFTRKDYLNFTQEFPQIECVMLGRGLIADPALPAAIRMPVGQKRDPEAEKQALRLFHDDVYHDYLDAVSGSSNIIHKMKELWRYMSANYENCEKELKQIKKARSKWDYQDAVNGFFERAAFREQEHIYF